MINYFISKATVDARLRCQNCSWNKILRQLECTEYFLVSTAYLPVGAPVWETKTKTSSVHSLVVLVLFFVVVVEKFKFTK